MIFREVEDRDLILKAQQGNVDAYNVLVSRWDKRVFAYLVRSVRDREDALDLAQDTFLKAYRGLAKLADVERFPQWLFRIAHNEAISMHRRSRPVGGEDELEVAASRSPELRTRAAAETTVMVEQALRNLPDDQREAVELKVYQGFKFHEIAEITEAPLSTVKSRVYAGMDALKTALAPAAAGPGASRQEV